MNENDQPTPSDKQALALVPIADMLPELRDEVYADVCAWDAARLELQAGYDEADGVLLAKIRDKLAPVGRWGDYLKARGLASRTAYDRINKAHGRYVESASKHNSNRAVAPGATARQLSAIEEAEHRAMRAENVHLKEELARLRADHEATNHQLAASNEMVKRLRASGKMDPGSAAGTFGNVMEEAAQWRARAEADRTARRKEGKAKAHRPTAEEKAQREAEQATQLRESYVQDFEIYAQYTAETFDILWHHIGLNLLTEAQLERIRALVPELRQLANTIATALRSARRNPHDHGNKAARKTTTKTARPVETAGKASRATVGEHQHGGH
ncbi:MAG: hypothetical protein C5B60_12585 [Chloroflexi bacterium]|nr:MAG: hypothetical protein C5B60_12585 [Chloroflexota bacterium]